MLDATTQPPPRDRTGEFEAPPPQSPGVATPAAPPSRPPPWAYDLVDAAPLALGVLLVIVLLRRPTWRRLALRALLSLAVAVAGAGAAFYATYLAGCRTMTCVDAAGLVPMLAGVVVGFIAGVTMLAFVWRRIG